MTGRRAFFGLCMLCALVFSALAAQSAGAFTKGTTGFTCIKFSGGQVGEHCLSSGSGASYAHSAIPSNTRMEPKLTNANTASETLAAAPFVLKVTVAGTPLEVKATELTDPGLPSFENRQAAGGEHYVAGEFGFTLGGVTVTKPEGKGCKVYQDAGGLEGIEGHVGSNPLVATTEGQGDSLKVEPALGFKGVLTMFFVRCNKGEVPEALEGTWSVTGSFKCPLNGATLACQHSAITEQNTLKAKGSKAGLEGSVTFSARHPGLDVFFTPLTFTTVETP